MLVSTNTAEFNKVNRKSDGSGEGIYNIEKKKYLKIIQMKMHAF